MTPAICCSFCKGSAVGVRVQKGPRNSRKLATTLFQAAKVEMKSVIFKKSPFHSCSSCRELLIEISNNYFQLQKQLCKIKAIILQNLGKSGNPESKSSCESLKWLVKDLNPSVLLNKIVPNEEGIEETCIRIKEEVEYEDFQDFGEILPNPEIGEVEGSSIEENFVNSSEDVPPDTRPELPSSPGSPLNTCTQSTERKVLKRKIPSPEEDSQQSESDQDIDVDKTPNSPKRIRTRKSGLSYRKRPRFPVLDEEGRELKLISHPSGSYSFGGIMMSPVSFPQSKKCNRNYKSKYQRNKFGKFKCGKCDRVLSGVYTMKGHVKEAHMGLERYGNNPKEIKISDTVRGDDRKYRVLHGIHIITTEDDKYECGSCHRIFDHRPNLILHIRHTHAKIPYKKVKKVYGPQIERVANRGKTEMMEDGRQILGGVEIVRVEDGTWKCGDCGRAWNRRGNVLTHIKKYHPDSTPYHCQVPECGAAFASKHLLNIHNVKHIEDRPFTCDRCGVSCKRKESLNDHILRVHLGKVRFQCPVPDCSKQFFGRYDCIRHMKMHKKENGGVELKEIKL